MTIEMEEEARMANKMKHEIRNRIEPYPVKTSYRRVLTFVCVCGNHFGCEFGSSTKSQWISITIVNVKASPTFFVLFFFFVSFFCVASFASSSSTYFPPSHKNYTIYPASDYCTTDLCAAIESISIASFYISFKYGRNERWFRFHNSVLFHFSGFISSIFLFRFFFLPR